MPNEIGGRSLPPFSPVFTASADVWHGGFYEFAIELGPRDDARLDAAIRALWEHPSLMGCVDRRDVEPELQERYSPSLAAYEQERGMLGVLSLPEDGARVACGTLVVREEESDTDWIGLFVPMGSLALVRNVGAFPFEDGTPSRPWREPLDSRMVELALQIHNRAPFRLALIGHEVSGETNIEKIVADRGIPDRRWIAYLISNSTAQSNRFLRWYPPTNYDAPFTIDPAR
jgi:hypothetical protein